MSEDGQHNDARAPMNLVGPATDNSTEVLRYRSLPRWLPWVLFGIMAALTVVGTITGGAAPKLLDNHPLLLVLGSPRYRWIMLVSPKVKAIPLIAISWVRLLASDPVYFMIGWFYGDKAMTFFESMFGKQAFNTVRKLFDKAAWVLSAFFAGPIICALAGVLRLKPKRFFTLDVLGTLIIAIALRLFANVLSEPLNSLIDFNKKYSKYILIVTVVTAVATLAKTGKKFKDLSGQVSKLNKD
jgi:membrane protein DedA with SNARE-associated domain